jgi:hypothetical protein
MDIKALFSPAEYVNSLWDMRVDGYTGFPLGAVSLTSYCSAKYGNSSNTGKFKAAIEKYSPTTRASFKSDEYSRIWSGQGEINNFETVLRAVNDNKEKFAADPFFKQYFNKTDFLQAMLDDACLGIDCIGFVGTYLDFACINRGYYASVPMDYCNAFPFVQDFTQIGALSVVVHCSGTHIQIINSIDSIFKDHLVVTLCQSSAGGPQINKGVTVRHGTGFVLDVDKFRAEKGQRISQAAYDAQKANDPSYNKSYKDFVNDAESALRKECTIVPATNLGYRRGAVFSIDGAGGNPVSGNVYIGTLKNMHVIDWKTESF